MSKVLGNYYQITGGYAELPTVDLDAALTGEETLFAMLEEMEIIDGNEDSVYNEMSDLFDNEYSTGEVKALDEGGYSISFYNFSKATLYKDDDGREYYEEEVLKTSDL